MFNPSPQKGVSIFFSFMVMTLLLSIALGLSSIFLTQVKISRDIGYSVVAFYAADTGIEQILMQRSGPISSCTKISPCFLDNGAEYFTVVKTPGLDCNASNYCITSIGVYKETRRAIEVDF